MFNMTQVKITKFTVSQRRRKIFLKSLKFCTTNCTACQQLEEFEIFLNGAIWSIIE